ncbi:MAG TPA: hypothetical protein VGQ49_11330 [Bryobacteraceae bacterium]|jgi:hypothetical protein|nr:hypothetical protein [Bryobacteraceae bacterium]
MAQFSFFPPSGPGRLTEKLGFRGGLVGTHTSRTMMLEELTTLLAAVPAPAARAEYVQAVVEANALAKPTTSTRRLTLQRLTELYALDPDVPIFRVLRKLWDLEPQSRPLLAVLVALARDPLLMATAPSILSLPPGTETVRQSMREALRLAVGERLSDATLDKVIRNAASSWTQSGHLAGRTFKSRQKVHASASTIAFALYLGNAAGFQGDELLTSGWVKTLDCRPSEALDAALDAKRVGLLDLRTAGGVFDLNLERLDPRPKVATR